MTQNQSNDKPSVVIFGWAISSAFLSGATILFRALSNAFLHRGWNVTFIEEYHSWIESQGDFVPQDPNLHILCYRDRNSLNELHSKHRFLHNAQLVLKFSGSSGSYDRYIDEWLAYERIEGQMPFFLVYVDADAPMRLPYIINHPNFYLHRILPAFDGVWVMLGGERAAQEYRIMQARDVWVLPAAIDPHEFQPMAAAIEYHADLLFVGNPTYGREAGLKRFFFDVARLCPQNHFLLSGADWTGVELPDNTRYLGYVPSQRLAQLYCSARLVLNVTREEMASYGDAAALRLFEAAACEACLVSDKWSGLDQLFSPEHEILLVDRTDDVVRYLTNVDWQTSRAIGRRARERVMSEHTAEIRLSQFLDLIGMS